MPSVSIANGRKITTFDDGTVIDELYVAPIADPPPPRWITPGALFDRLGAHKLMILSDPDLEVQALVKDCSVRRYIDLARPDLLLGLQLVQSKGHDIDPATIVNAPILDVERP